MARRQVVALRKQRGGRATGRRWCGSWLQLHCVVVVVRSSLVVTILPECPRRVVAPRDAQVIGSYGELIVLLSAVLEICVGRDDGEGHG